MSDILAVIPAYNEENTLRSVIESLKKSGHSDILVVDDGSSDRTFDTAAALGVYVARHAMNRGAGSAAATGFEIARILDPDILVTFDADGQHDADDIIKLTAPIRKGEADVVIGSRMLGRPGMPRQRIFYNSIANIVTFLIYGFSVSDTQSGFRAFSRKAYNAVNIGTSKMEYCSEIVHEIKRNRLSYKEVPVRTIYTDYSMSKGQGFAVGVKTLIRLILDRLSRR